MNEASGATLNSFLTGTFSQVIGSPSKNQWAISLDPASATTSDISYTALEVTCHLADYPSITALESFRVAVHEITIDFPDMHVLINGETYYNNDPSWTLSSVVPGINYDNFIISNSRDTTLSHTIHTS